MARRRGGTSREYPRTARLGVLLREILADELERIDDPRLGLLTITDVTVDADLHIAEVTVSHLLDDSDDETVMEVLDELRPQLRRAISRQARVRRTPELHFRPDLGLQSAARVEDILRGLDAPADREAET